MNKHTLICPSCKNPIHIALLNEQENLSISKEVARQTKGLRDGLVKYKKAYKSLKKQTNGGGKQSNINKV